MDRNPSLRGLLEGSGTVVAPFVYDALQARAAQAAGFQAVYMSGFGTAAARGFPDVGLLTMDEMVSNARYIARAVDVPVISDADTGYGNPINVQRTVREFEAAGVAAIHIEDQVWPKKCGFLDGKQVIPLEEHVQKVLAACEARSRPDFLIIARTDALAVTGWDDVARRARAYRDAGADLIFVDGIRTLEDLDRYQRELGDLPLLYNGQLVPADEIQARGFKLMICSATMMASFAALLDAMSELRERGSIRGADPRLFRDLVDLLGVPEVFATEKRFAGSG